jgi:hypothetical protein
MYGSELVVNNPSDRAIKVSIRKRKGLDDLASEILCDQNSVLWAIEGRYFVFAEEIGPHTEKCFRVVHPEQADARNDRRSLRFELAVAVRRILSEFRDDYLSTSQILSGPAERLKNALKKAV